MSRLIAIGCILLLALAVACGRSDLFGNGTEERQAVTIARYKPPAPNESNIRALSAELPGQAIPTERQLIRIAHLDLIVDDPESIAEQIRQLAGTFDGYVGAADARRQQGVVTYSMSVHVAATELDNAISRFKALASRVDRERVRSEDVTDQIIDFDARLRTLRATETELLGLLASSESGAHALEDVMAVYRELTRIRSEIEQSQARVESLRERVSLSTINLQLHPTEAARPVVADPWSAADVARSSFRSLIVVLQAMAGLLIFLLVVALPVAVVLAVPAWGAFRLLERYHPNRPKPASS